MAEHKVTRSGMSGSLICLLRPSAVDEMAAGARQAVVTGIYVNRGKARVVMGFKGSGKEAAQLGSSSEPRRVFYIKFPCLTGGTIGLGTRYG